MIQEKNEEKGTKAKQPIWYRMLRFFFFLFLFLVVLIAVALFAANSYLNSNKTKILEDLPFLNNGTITFEQASINIFRDFPSATLELENVSLSDSLIEEHQKPILQVGKIEAALSLTEWRNKNFEVNSIRLADGTINLFKDEKGYSNVESIIKKHSDETNNKGVKVNTQNVQLILSNIHVHFDDAIKRTSIHGRVNELTAAIDRRKGLAAHIALLLEVDELAFKKENGSFIPNSVVSGEFDLNLENDILQISPFDLEIDDEHFLFQATINTKKTSPSTLIFENKESRQAKLFSFLPPQIQKTLKDYKVEGEFYSKTTIKSSFQPKELPIIDIDLQMLKNDLTVRDLFFEEATLNARFINRLYDDERRAMEGKKNVRFEIKSLETKYGQFDLQTKDALISFTPEQKARINIAIDVAGKASGISDWLENDQFFFDKGNFKLHAKVDAPLNDKDKILIASDADLKLENVSVIYKPANTVFPIKELILGKQKGDAKFSMVSSTIFKEHDFFIEGGLKNIIALLVDLSDGQTTSEVNMKADKLSWTDFLDLFGENGYLKSELPKTDQQKKKSMKETINGFQSNFEPRLSIEVDTLQYFDMLQLQNFKTGAHFENGNTLVLEETTFSYGKGEVQFDAQLDLSEPDQTPFEFELDAKDINLQKLLPPLNYMNIALLKNFENYPDDLMLSVKLKGLINDETGLVPNTAKGEITFKSKENKTVSGKITFEPDKSIAKNEATKSHVNTHVELYGNPKVFNNFFKTEDFIFDKGSFDVQFDYTGDVTSFEQLLNEGKVNLTIKDSEVLYKAADIYFPLTRIDLNLQDDEAGFDFLLRSDEIQSELNFIGVIKNLSELVIGNTGKTLSTKVNVFSPRIDWDVLLFLLTAQKATSKSMNENTIEPESMKTTVKGILNKFNPKLQARVDTFVYSDKLVVYDVKTGIRLLDASTLVLDETGFDFHDGSMRLNGQLDLSRLDQTPFLTTVATQDFDVARLLESLDYLSIHSLENLEKLKGRITMKLDLSGIVAKNGVGLIPEATQGILDFDIHNVELKGLGILDTLAAKVRQEKRFHDLMFAPLSNRITIKGTHIDIPLMEVQSNALNVFVEGHVNPAEKSNVWISFPMDNLKKADRTIIPDKRGYGATKDKIYFEIATNDKGENKMKLHISKKKFYKERGILHLYKEDKVKYKAIRKELKKNKVSGE